ncbi:MAG: hypothetical protein M3Q56_00420 [Bacteroidota bacterium]|nr:hypothetical protein [Bacteroidota bacterium]
MIISFAYIAVSSVFVLIHIFLDFSFSHGSERVLHATGGNIGEVVEHGIPQNEVVACDMILNNKINTIIEPLTKRIASSNNNSEDDFINIHHRRTPIPHDVLMFYKLYYTSHPKNDSVVPHPPHIFWFFSNHFLSEVRYRLNSLYHSKMNSSIRNLFLLKNEGNESIYYKVAYRF